VRVRQNALRKKKSDVGSRIRREVILGGRKEQESEVERHE
jgi:hypothetical protein